MDNITNDTILKVLPELDGIPKNLIYLCYRGSIASNTYIPPISDVDLMGVYILPREYYIGISQHKTLNPTTVEVKQEVNGTIYDCVFHEFRHFLTMALRCNPNVICGLWVRPEHILMVRHKFNVCLNLRNYFLSRKQLYKSFTGYALAQLQGVRDLDIHGYMGEKRKRMVEKYGYDVKNAAQLVYLLHVGIEALETSQLNVFRTEDAGLIKSIKMGEWALDDVKLYADNLFHHAKKAYEQSKLQEEPKTDRIENMIVMMLKWFIVKNCIVD